MSYCGKCGAQLSDGAIFCPKCGTSVSPVINDGANNIASKKIIMPLVILVLVLAIAGGGWYLWKNQSEDYSLEGLAKAIVNYDAVGEFHCGRAYVIKYINNPDGSTVFKYGYIDKMGNEVIPCKYVGDEMTDYDFYEGLTAVYNGEKNAYIDVDGKEITSFIYDEAGRFSEGLAVAIRDGKYFIIDTSGKELVELKFTADLGNDCFSEGMFPVWGNEGLGFINTKGELVIPCKYSSDPGIYFSEGLVSVFNGNKYGYIDKTGKEVIPFIYDQAYPFSDGLAPVNKDGKWFYIDKSGKNAFETNSDCLGFEDGLAVEYSEDGQTHFYIDKTGEKAFENEYDAAEPFKDGYARVGKKSGDDYLYGIIDKKGNEVIPCKYKNLYSLSDRLALIQNDDSYGFVDLHGNSTFDIENQEVKNLVKKKLKEKKEKKRKEEEERKRYEEEHSAVSIFNKVNDGDVVWEHYLQVRIEWNGGYTTYERYTWGLFFYPITKNSGKVSILQSHEHSIYLEPYSKHCSYQINNDIIYISENVEDYHYHKYVTLELLIEKQSDNRVQLKDIDSGWNFGPKRKTYRDIMKN